MDSIPMDFAPREPATKEEWECFYEDLVRDFMVQQYGGIVSQVDITAFAVKYLHMHITSALFAEESEHLTSFLADGTSAVTIWQKGKLLHRVYPPGTIAVNHTFCLRGRDDDVVYYQFRFAIAVGCAQWICRGFRRRGITQAKQGAARLLMPRFLVLQLLDKYYGGNKIPIYGSSLYPFDMRVPTMAKSLGVNQTPMFYRIQALDLLEPHPREELVKIFFDAIKAEKKRQEEALPEKPDADTREEAPQEGPDENSEDPF